MRTRTWVGTIGAITLLGGGCDGGPSGPDVSPEATVLRVEGRISWGGEPLPGVVVGFGFRDYYPERNRYFGTERDTTDALGRFEISIEVDCIRDASTRLRVAYGPDQGPFLNSGASLRCTPDVQQMGSIPSVFH